MYENDCKALDKPVDYYTPLPDGDGHCFDCHCRCVYREDGCGHTAGCPGC